MHPARPRYFSCKAAGSDPNKDSIRKRRYLRCPDRADRGYLAHNSVTLFFHEAGFAVRRTPLQSDTVSAHGSWSRSIFQGRTRPPPAQPSARWLGCVRYARWWSHGHESSGLVHNGVGPPGSWGQWSSLHEVCRPSSPWWLVGGTAAQTTLPSPGIAGTGSDLRRFVGSDW
jgi:hypothetical protein